MQKQTSLEVPITIGVYFKKMDRSGGRVFTVHVLMEDEYNHFFGNLYLSPDNKVRHRHNDELSAFSSYVSKKVEEAYSAYELMELAKE